MNDRVAPDPANVGGGRVTTDVLVQIFGGVANAALGVVATVLIARGLGSATFGQWMTIFAVVQIAAFVTDFGIEGAAIRRAADDRGRERDWLGAAAALRFALTVPVAALCVGCLLVMSSGPAMRVAAVLITGTLLLGVPGVIANVVFGLRVRNDLLVATITVNSVLWTSIVIAISPAEDDLVPLALAFLVVAALTALLQTVLALRKAVVRWPGSPALRRDLRRLALPIGLASMLTFAYGRIDQALVFQLAGARDAGLYGAAYRVLTQAALVPTAVMTTLFPILTAARADTDRLRRAAQDAADYVAMLALPVLAFALVEAEPLVGALFGAEFAGAAPAMRILIVALLPISLGYLAATIGYVLGEQWRLVRYAMLGLLVNVAFNVALIPTLGFLAAAYVTVLTEALVAGLALRLVTRRLMLRPRLDRVARSGVSALLLMAALALSAQIGASLLIDALLTAVLYPACLVVTGALRRRDLAALSRRWRDWGSGA